MKVASYCRYSLTRSQWGNSGSEPMKWALSDGDLIMQQIRLSVELLDAAHHMPGFVCVKSVPALQLRHWNERCCDSEEMVVIVLWKLATLGSWYQRMKRMSGPRKRRSSESTVQLWSADITMSLCKPNPLSQQQFLLYDSKHSMQVICFVHGFENQNIVFD